MIEIHAEWTPKIKNSSLAGFSLTYAKLELMHAGTAEKNNASDR